MTHGWIAFVALAALVTPAAAGAPSQAPAPAPPPSADSADRCARGLEHARAHDLPRASLYLEACDPAELGPDLAAEVARTRAAVAHELDEGKLSALSIVTTPAGLVAETDALPGERFTTPATIWTKAGDYQVSVATDAAALDAGKGLTAAASIDTRSRRTVIINLPTRPGAPKSGKVDFTDETPEQTAHTGPPPAVRHGTLLPKKYLGPSEPSGIELDDPFAPASDGTLRWRLGARASGGMFLHDGADAGAVFGIAMLARRPLAGPVALSARVSWAHRDLDAFGLEVGTAFRLAATPHLVLAATTAVRAEVRVQDELAMEPVARVGLGAAAGLDLALSSIPLTLGLRVEPSFTELVPGARNHTALFEVGYDF